jgi:hypothetical protein
MPYTPSVKNVDSSWLDRLIAPSNHRPFAIAYSASIKTGRAKMVSSRFVMCTKEP